MRKMNNKTIAKIVDSYLTIKSNRSFKKYLEWLNDIQYTWLAHRSHRVRESLCLNKQFTQSTKR